MIFTNNILRLLLLDTLIIGVLNRDCPRIHLQREYCDNEVVFTANLTDPVNYKGPIRLRIQKLLKDDHSLLDNSKGNIVNVEATMGLAKRLSGFRKEGEFVMFVSNINGTFYADECQTIALFNALKPFQKILFYGGNVFGCSCIEKIGKFTDDMYCEYSYSLMTIIHGKCSWLTTKSYVECKKKESTFI